MTERESPFDSNALWMKAVSFVNRSFDALDNSDFPLAATWAAVALELLGKSTLANLNPCLVADPSDDGISLLIAAGVLRDYSRAKSIPAKAVFSRCRRAFPAFSADEALRVASARNEELHSGLMPFDAIADTDSWWGKYWAQVVILVEARGDSVESFVGTMRVEAVDSWLASNAEHVRLFTERRIAEAVERWSVALSSVQGANTLAAFLTRLPQLSVEFSSSVVCPACDHHAVLLGDEVESSEIDSDSAEGPPFEVLTVYPDTLECRNCGLFLDGRTYLAEVGLDALFSVERGYEPVWDDYGND